MILRAFLPVTALTAGTLALAILAAFPPKPVTLALARLGADDDGTFTLEWPQPEDPSVYQIGVYRHFHPLGLLRVLFLHLCRVRPDRYDLFRRLVLTFAEEARISGDPIPEIERESVGDMSFDRVYDLRLLACQLAAEGCISQGTLDGVFDRTHFQTDPIAPEHFLEACDLLRG